MAGPRSSSRTCSGSSLRRSGRNTTSSRRTRRRRMPRRSANPRRCESCGPYYFADPSSAPPMPPMLSDRVGSGVAWASINRPLRARDAGAGPRRPDGAHPPHPWRARSDPGRSRGAHGAAHPWSGAPPPAGDRPLALARGTRLRAWSAGGIRRPSPRLTSVRRLARATPVRPAAQSARARAIDGKAMRGNQSATSVRLTQAYSEDSWSSTTSGSASVGRAR